ncbi:MAG TPA: hypothetical protein ENJ09_05535 [Planctomycetes bacterium]|nr:hypothetical protein [Planctomycetota bacterium]
MRSPLHFLLSFLALATGTSAQLSHPSVPASVRAGLGTDVPTVVVPRPDVEALLAEDLERGAFPLRYGAVLPLALSIDTDGRWDETEDSYVWRVEVHSPGAFSLGLQFGTFDLPPSGELFVTTPDRSIRFGAYRSDVALPDGSLPIQPLAGQRAVIEYVQPKSEPGAPRLALESVVYDYRDVFALARTPSVPSMRSQVCLVDVNCPEGAPYQDIKNAVVGLYRGGFVCSGSMLNNSANDGTPYMLTADHCGDMTGAVVAFHYERTGCGSGSSTNQMTVAGATLLAKSNLYDSQLYLLNQAPPRSYSPYYAGWDRGQSQNGPMISISHPAGNPKKIAIANSDPIDSGTQWAAQWDVGVIQGGSSGSPLFNGSGRVVGPACCVSNFTCGNQIAYYGKLQRFYNSKNLGVWLDPRGKGFGRIDGYDPFAPVAEVENGSGANPQILSSALPALGSAWSATVDASAFPQATSTTLLGTLGASSGTFVAAGELLLDFGTPTILRSNAPVSGGSSVHTGTIPNDPTLEGLESHIQAVLLGGSAQLTNAVRLVVN